MVDYPKTLSKVNTDTVPDEIGFTDVEKVALTNVWRLIGARRRKIATEIFLEVFTQNHHFLSYFRDVENRIDCENLHHHPKVLLDTIGILITEGIYDEARFKLILHKIVSAHQKHAINMKEIEIMATAVKSHLLKSVERFLSPTINIAIKKLLDKLVSAHDVEVIVESVEDITADTKVLKGVTKEKKPPH